MKLTDYSPLRFFPKFLLILNLYANFFLLGALAAAIGLWACLVFLPAGLLQLALSVLAGLVIAGCLFEYFVISSRLPAKWKYYRVNYKRLQKNGFQAKFFMDEMYEPCMRLLIRDLLRVSGLSQEWPSLVRAWKGNGAKNFEDMMKQRILSNLEKDG